MQRFDATFRGFVETFATADHPLALFLDDLQWLDEASTALIARIVADGGFRHLLLIGAYRDDEVSASHPLQSLLDRLRSPRAASL